MEGLVERFTSTFNRLSRVNLGLLDELYAPEVVFTDPFHHIVGLEGVRAYFARQYEGVIRCSFTFEDRVVQGGTAMLTWTMRLDHTRFCKGRTIHLAGASHIRFIDKVTYHRDYFDVGEFLYERIPVFGTVVRMVKERI